MAKRLIDDEQRDRGAVMVEFALILPLLLLLVVGIIQFGLFYNTQIALQGAAREGARALALGDSATAAVNDASGGVAMSISSQDGCEAGDAAAGKFAKVTTSTTFTFRIPFVSLGTTPMNATASMRCGL